jgi:hypothetical protein
MPVDSVRGRPTDYDPGYCELVVKDMSEGYTLSAFAGLIGVSRGTINRWMERHPDFNDAVQRGKAMQLRAWEKDARNIAKGGGGPGASTMVVFGLSNLGDGEWRNKQDFTVGNPDGSKLERTVIILPHNGRD